jgi:Niemann-Pick C1 protein
MFLYVTLTLGKYSLHDKSITNSHRTIFRVMFDVFESLMIDMKFTLGLAGVLIVLLSVTSSIGLFSYIGVRATLIIFEVN